MNSLPSSTRNCNRSLHQQTRGRFTKATSFFDTLNAFFISFCSPMKHPLRRSVHQDFATKQFTANDHKKLLNHRAKPAPAHKKGQLANNN